MTETPTPRAPASRSFWARCIGSTPRDRENLRRVLWTYLGWAVLFAGGSQLIKRGVLPEGPASWAVVGATVVVALLVLKAYGRFLREADELQRAIHLEGMGLGFGASFLALPCYRMAERAGAPPADIADAMVFLAVFFAIGIVRASGRYK